MKDKKNNDFMADIINSHSESNAVYYGNFPNDFGNTNSQEWFFRRKHVLKRMENFSEQYKQDKERKQLEEFKEKYLCVRKPNSEDMVEWHRKEENLKN